MRLTISDAGGQKRAAHKVGHGSRLLVGDGSKVRRGDRLFEWDPYTIPIIAECPGVIRLKDLVSGVSIREEADEITGMRQRIVSDWQSGRKNVDLKPEIQILGSVDAEGPVLVDGRPAAYPMSVDAILSVEDGVEVEVGDVIARIPREGARTKDITGGLPRVAELFEARRPKDHAIIAEIEGRICFEKDYKNKTRIKVLPDEEDREPAQYLVQKGRHIPVQDGDLVKVGDYIVDGNPAPHDILRILGVEALADYLINEVQDVYRLQGVKINDKHIEVIVRQMLQKYEIIEPGETTLLQGEQVDKSEFDEVNARAVANGRNPAKGEPVLLGITKAALQTRSFISAASFQETTRVLTEAAVQGKRDNLIGLKENVIVGRLIPAGTGGAVKQIRQVANERDQEIIEQREAEAAAALPPPEIGEEFSTEETVAAS